MGEFIWWESWVEVSLVWGVKPSYSPSIKNFWSDVLWLKTQMVSLLNVLLYRLVNYLFLACLIFFPSSELLEIGPVSYLATYFCILVLLSRHLASLAVSFFDTNERLWMISKIYAQVELKFHSVPFLSEFENVLNFYVCTSWWLEFFSISSTKRLSKSFISNLKGYGLSWILGFCFFLL